MVEQTQGTLGGERRKRVVLIHAYSRENSGDGLLVDESVALIKDADSSAMIDLVALAPETFPEFPDAIHPIYGRSSASSLGLLKAALLSQPHQDVKKLYDSADLIIAVGGGYLRADGLRGLFKTWVAHVAQIPASSSSTPFVYLPQSIGPFPRWMSRVKRLRGAQRVYVRDSRSAQFLDSRKIRNTRLPDLATLEVSVAARQASRTKRIALVARSLTRRPGPYEKNLLELQHLTNAVLLVQSRGRGNDDPAFYQKLGFENYEESLQSKLNSQDLPAVVVSVRLHGSLQALRAGIPTVHLSYERKGWGAFEDLGLSEYVHNARSFSPRIVADQVQKLAEDPTSYWAAVKEASDHLRKSRRILVDEIHAGLAD